MKINELFSDVITEDLQCEFKAQLNRENPVKWATRSRTLTALFTIRTAKIRNSSASGMSLKPIFFDHTPKGAV